VVPVAKRSKQRFQASEKVQVVQRDFLDASLYLKVGVVLGYTSENERNYVMVKFDDRVTDLPEASLNGTT
jgi:hypothetical protein